MSTDSTRYFIYARKSTDDPQRQVRSIDDQLAELRQLARREQLEVVHVFVEKQTAKKPGRPIFNAMLARIEKGEASGILAWHPDRLSRNSLDSGKLIYDFDGGIIKSLRFPNLLIDPTAHGKFMLSIMFGQSKYYVDNLSEHIKRGLRNKVKNGIWPVVAPIGYLNDRRSRRIVPDPERAPLIRRMFQLYATGLYSLDRLTLAMNELGMTNRQGKPMPRSNYHRMFHQRVYHGLIEFGDEVHDGLHEPLVTKRLFDRCQQVLQAKTSPKAPSLKPYVYRGFLRCGECGCFMTTETQKGHNYLRCTKRVKRHCSQPYVREEVIAGQITEQIKLMAPPEDVIDWMFQQMEIDKKDESESLSNQLARLRQRTGETEDKIQRLMNAYLDQDIAVEEFREHKTRLANEKLTLKQELAEMEGNKTG